MSGKRLIIGLVALCALAPILYITTALLLNLRTPAATDLASSAQLKDPPAALSKPVTLRVATFNIQALWIVGKHRDIRMPAIAEAVGQLAPDVIGFQEAFVKKDRDRLVALLKAKGYPYHRYFRSGYVGSGLLFSSRLPFAEEHFERYRDWGKAHKLWHGDYYAGKGVALVRIELADGAGYLDVFNTHAHAGYGEKDYIAVRMNQMLQLVDYIKRATTGTSPALALGDFNVSKDEPAYGALVEGADLERLMALPTRIDHVFAVRNPRYEFITLDTTPIAGEIQHEGERIELSDHTGYMTTIRIQPVEESSP